MRFAFGMFHTGRSVKLFALRHIQILPSLNNPESFLFSFLFNLQGGREMNWKKLVLIGSVAGLLAFVPVQRSDAGVSVGIGIGFPGYYGYYPYGYYYPYRYYYRPNYWYGGHRYCRHGHHNYYRR